MARLTRATLLQFGIELLQTALGFVAIVYFARLLGSGTLGQYFLSLAVVNVLMVPSAGLRGTTMKRVSEDRDQDAFFTVGALAQFSVLIVTLIGIGVFHEPLNDYLGFDGVMLVAALTAFRITATFLNGMLRADHRVELASVVSGSWEIGRILLQFGLVLGGLGLVGLLLGEVVAAAAIGVVLYAMLSLEFVRPKRRHVAEIYQYGKYAWFSSIKPFTYSWMDVVVLGFFVTNSLIGVYEVAWRVTALFILLPSAMAKTVFPDVSRLAEAGDIARIQEMVGTATTFAGFLAIPGLVGGIVLGADVLRIYGDEFAVGGVVLVILTVARLAESYETFLIQSLNGLDRPDITFKTSAVFVVINLPLNVLLVWYFGIIGAAVATAIAMLASGLLSLRALHRLVGVTVDPRPLLLQTLSALFMGVVVYATKPLVRPVTELETLMLVLLGASVYLGLLIIVSEEVRTQMRRTLGGSWPS